MEAIERIKREMIEGQNITQMIDEQKGAFSVGKTFNADLLRIGKTVFDRVMKNIADMKQHAKKKGKSARLAIVAMV